MEMFGGMISPDAKFLQQKKKDENLITLIKSVTEQELIDYASKIRNNEPLSVIDFNRLVRISFAMGTELYQLNLNDLVDQHRKVLRNVILRCQGSDFSKEKIVRFLEILNEIPNYEWLSQQKEAVLDVNKLPVPAKFLAIGENELTSDFSTLTFQVKEILSKLTIPVNIAFSVSELLEKPLEEWTDSDYMVFNSVFYQESLLDMNVIDTYKDKIENVFANKDLERILNVGFESVDQTNQTIMGTEILMMGMEFLQKIKQNSIQQVANYISEIALSFVAIPNEADGLDVATRSKLIKIVESFLPAVDTTNNEVEETVVESDMIYDQVAVEIENDNLNPEESNPIKSLKNLLLEKNDFMRFEDEQAIVDLITSFDYYSSKEAQESAVLLTEFIKKTISFAPQSFVWNQEVNESFNNAVKTRDFNINTLITLLTEKIDELRKQHKIKVKSLILPIDKSVKEKVLPIISWLIRKSTYLDFETKAYLVSVYFDGIENSVETYNQLIQIIGLVENGYIAGKKAHYYTELKGLVENTDIVIPAETEDEETVTIKLLEIFKNNASVEDDLQQLAIVNSFSNAFKECLKEVSVDEKAHQ